MLKIREYTSTDEQEVRSIHERCSDFPLPDLINPNYVIKEVAVLDDKIIGLGAIRLTSEVLTILDLDVARSTRAKAVELLLRTGIYKSQKLGIDEMHAFLTGEITHSFADVLRRKYGFEDVHGIPLTLRLGD